MVIVWALLWITRVCTDDNKTVHRDYLRISLLNICVVYKSTIDY